jgi:nucleoside-diphosphate-sugar epimerase
MPRSLVTGATGFVGSNLAKHLRQQGWDVRCLVRDIQRAKHLEELGAELTLGRLDDFDSLVRAVADVDVVFHAAGRLHALTDQQFTADNVEGTRNVARACTETSRPPALIFISSLAAGGPSRPGEPRLEGDEDRPISAYGESKLAAERAAAALAYEVPLSIVRPPIIFGQRDLLGLKIFRGVQKLRLHVVPGLRKFPVSVVHVSDLCDALVRVAERGARVAPSSKGRPNTAAGTYHVAAERTIMYGELGRLAARAIGCRAVALPVPKILFWFLGGLAEVYGRMRGRPGLLNLDKIREAVAPGWECSDEKIRAELGYQPAATLEERFAETADWYREHGWL